MQRISVIITILLLIFPKLLWADISIQTAIGGNLTSFVLVGDEVLLAEGESVIRIGEGADGFYRTLDRLYLRQPMLDLAQHPQGIYALSTEGIFILSPDGRIQKDFIPMGGQNLHVQDDWLVVVAQTGGLRLFQIQADGALQSAGFIDTPGTSYDVVLHQDNLMAVADGIAGLRLYNRNTLAPTDAVPEVAPAYRVASQANQLFVASKNYVALMSSGQIIGHYAPIQHARRSLQINNWLVIADAEEGLKIYDGQTLTYQQGEINRPTFDLIQVDNQLISAGSDGIHRYDASALPELRELETSLLSAPPTTLALWESNTLVGTDRGGLQIFEVNGFRPVGSVPINGRITDIGVRDSQAYLTVEDGRLVTVDLRNNSIVSTLPLAGDPQDITISGNEAIVASGVAGFYVLQLGATPQVRERLPARYAYAAQFMADGQIALQDGDQLRIKSPDNTERILPMIGRGIMVMGDQLVVVGENHINRIASTNVTRYVAPQNFTDLMPVGNELWITSQDANAPLVHLDISNPTRPTELPAPNFGQGVRQAAWQNNSLFLLDDHNAFHRIGLDQRETVSYQGLANIDQLVGTASGLILMGGSTHYFNVNTRLFSEIDRGTVRDAAALDENHAMLHANGDVSIYDQNGKQTALFADLDALSIAASGSAWWIGSRGGLISELTPSMPDPIVRGRIELEIQDLAWHQDRLLIATPHHQLLSWQPDGTVSQPVDMQSAIQAITALNDGTLLISTDNGFLSLDADLNVLDQRFLTEPVTNIIQQENWLAVANNVCGLRLYTYPELTEIGRYAEGLVTDVVAVGGEVWIAKGGSAVWLDIDVSTLAAPYSLPFAPNPPDQMNLAQPLSTLSWQPAPDDCQPFEYELMINGSPITRLTEPSYTSPYPLTGSVDWQVNVIGTDGTRLEGAVWHVNSSQEGWVNAPQQVAANRLQPDQNDLPIDPITGGLILIGVCSLSLAGVYLSMVEKK